MDSNSSNKKKALLSAVKLSSLKHVKDLVKSNGIQIDQTWFDYTLLIAALERGHTGIINFLLQNNCRVRRASNTNSYTPLHYAVMLEDKSILKKLMQNNALIYDKDGSQETPFDLAMRLKKYDIVNLMLSLCDFDHISINKNSIALFHIACKLNNLKAIKKFVRRKFPINSHASMSTDEEFHRSTPLHFAVNNGSSMTTRYLLEHGANITAKIFKTWTPLHLAYYKSNTTLVQLILQNLDDDKCIDSADETGLSHLHICCTINSSSIAESFLKNKANINCSVSMESSKNPGYTPLHFAIENHCEKVIALLLDYHADTTIKCKNGLTPLHLACEIGNLQIIKLLLKYKSVLTVKDDLGRTPLHLAFYEDPKYDDLINLLLLRIPKDVDYADSRGLSHFHIACTRSNSDIVKQFLQHGVSVNSSINPDNDIHSGFSALHFAVDFNQETVVRLLLENNADVNIKTINTKITPLHVACTHSNNKLYKFINIEETDENVYNNVDWVSNRQNQMNILQLLLKYKADVNAVDSLGKTPLICVFEIIERPLLDDDINYYDYYKYPQYASILKEVNCRILEIVHILLAHNADIHICTQDGQSILHVISQETRLERAVELAKLFLSKGVDVQVADKWNGATPLHIAVDKSRKNLVELFLDHNAKINAKNIRLSTPLHLAVSHPEPNEAIVDLLLANGSYVNERNACEETPLHKAVFWQNKYVIEKILRHGADINSENSWNGAATSTMSICIRTGVYNTFDNSLQVLELLVNHIKKLKAAGLLVTDKVETDLLNLNSYAEDYFVNYPDSPDISLKCAEELERLENVNLRSLLLKDENEMSRLVNNESLKKALTADGLEDDFPLYGYLLKLQLRRGLERAAALESAKDSLRFLTGLDLPDVCTDKIFKYLNRGDLDGLIEASDTDELSAKRRRLS